MKRAIQFTLGLGMASAIAIVVSHLALTDISHGEPDLTQEWKALQVSFLVIVSFHVSSMYTLIKLLKQKHKGITAQKHKETNKEPRDFKFEPRQK